MQTLTSDLLDTLASRFQAAAHGYRARVEIDWVLGAVASPSVEPTQIQARYGIPSHPGGPTWRYYLNASSTTGDLLVLSIIGEIVTAVPDGWIASVLNQNIDAGGGSFYLTVLYKASAGEIDVDITMSSSVNASHYGMVEWSGLVNPTVLSMTVLRREVDLGFATVPEIDYPAGPALVLAVGGFQHGPGSGDSLGAVGTDATLCYPVGPPADPNNPTVGMEYATVNTTAGSYTDWAFSFTDLAHTMTIGLVFVGAGAEPTTITTSLRPIRVSIDKSQRLAAAEMQADFENEAGLIGVSPSSYTQPHSPVRLWEWYGDNANEIRTFTGLMDAIREGRDVRTVQLVARDLMKRLIVQTFSATAPQGADEDGAVRMPANGVYLETEASDIVSDILDRAGWPTADRAITPTNYMLDEYIVPDGSTWAEAIINENGPTGLAGYEAGADELGIFYFRPLSATAAPDSDTDPTPDYSYVVADPGTDNLTSRNIIRLDHDLDDYDLKTRIKVRGNLATAKPAWTELWHSNSFKRPVGLWWDSADASHVRVLDRSTSKIYNFRITSPRDRDPAGIWPLYVGGDVNYPLGLSGDPADSDRFWVLDAAWRATGSANLNASIHKYDASSGAHLAEYSLPDGEWSDLKVSSSFLWLTNKTTDKIHKRSKTDGSAIDSYTTMYNSNAQQNPTGVFVDGTTLGLFFLGHARFLLVDESDPTTVDSTNALGVTSGVISTAGTGIYGGEMKTTTHDRMWACNDDLSLIWEFQLTEPTTNEISVEIADSDLEDELGFLSGAEDRIHDTHPLDPAHPYEIRRATVTLEKTITNIAQATETAQRILAELAHRREALDVGLVGHPGLQRGDLVKVTDPVMDIDQLWVLDTYRDNMDDRGYLGTAALLPYDPQY